MHLRDALFGAITVAAIGFSYLWGVGEGRAGIVRQCVEHRAFTYRDGAWGCVRLRKSVRQVEEKDVILNGEVKT